MKIKKFRPLYRFIRFHFAYAIRPASKKKESADHIGEVKAWTVKENTSPYKDNIYYFYDGGSFEDWLVRANKESKHTQDVIRRHQKYPWATLSQLNYRPKKEEKKLNEVKNIVVDEDALMWELRSICDNMLLARSKGNTKVMTNWLNGVSLEEMEGLSRQEIAELDANDLLNKIKTLMYFNEKGDDEYIGIDGIKRVGKLYGISGFPNKIKTIFRKKK